MDLSRAAPGVVMVICCSVEYSDIAETFIAGSECNLNMCFMIVVGILVHSEYDKCHVLEEVVTCASWEG